jgi:hypothetical protein
MIANHIALAIKYGTNNDFIRLQLGVRPAVQNPLTKKNQGTAHGDTYSCKKLWIGVGLNGK